MKRKLIIGERIMYVDAQTPLNCVFTVKLRGTLTLVNLQSALAKIQQKHPLLKASIKEDEAGIPYFVSNPAIAEIPVHIIERQDDDHWKAVSKEEWGKLFNYTNQPLARVVWLKGETVSELLLVFPHCVGDGTTFVVIMNELLQLLDHPEKELTSYLPFESIESLLASSFSSDGKKVFKARLFAIVAKVFFLFKSVKHKPAGNSYLLHWKLAAEATSGLVTSCKTEGVTVHAALCVAFLEAFMEIKGKAAHGKVICPVDVRKFVQEIKEDNMFAFAPIAELVVSPEKGVDFWVKARKLKEDLTEKIAAMKVPELLVMSEYFHATVHKMVKYLRATDGTHDVTLSNMGKLNIAAHYDSFQVESIYSPSVAFPWRNSNTLIISTFKEEMDFCFCSNDAFLDPQEAGAIKERMLEILKQEVMMTKEANMAPNVMTSYA